MNLGKREQVQRSWDARLYRKVCSSENCDYQVEESSRQYCVMYQLISTC